MSAYPQHPGAVGDESGPLDDEPSVVTDEDRLGVDPLEEGRDPAEGWSRRIRLGNTARDEAHGETLDYRLPQEEPDVQPDDATQRPLADVPLDELDSSVDERLPAEYADGVGMKVEAEDVEPTGLASEDSAGAVPDGHIGEGGGPEQQCLRLVPED